MTTTAYIAGPMTNRPYFNFPAFDAVARFLRKEQGWTAYNPHEHDQEKYPTIDEAEATKVGDVVALADEIGFSFAGAMAWDLEVVAFTDAIVMLPDWEQSTGARSERFVAEMTGSSIWLANCDPYSGEWYITLDSVQKRMSPASLEPVRRVEGEDIEALEAVHANPVWTTVQQRTILATPGVWTVVDRSDNDPRNVDGTTIQTSETGGQKGAKSVELGRLPQAALRGVAEHFHMGSQKYPDVAPGVANWSLGYDWSLSLEALKRHLSLWESGEDNDPEFGTSHLRAVGFHALVLAEFEIQGWGTDDRRTPLARNLHVDGVKRRAVAADYRQALHERYRNFDDLNENSVGGGL